MCCLKSYVLFSKGWTECVCSHYVILLKYKWDDFIHDVEWNCPQPLGIITFLGIKAMRFGVELNSRSKLQCELVFSTYYRFSCFFFRHIRITLANTHDITLVWKYICSTGLFLGLDIRLVHFAMVGVYIYVFFSLFLRWCVWETQHVLYAK